MCDENEKAGFQRVRFFKGLVLTEDDFNAEQEYHISKRRYFNQCMYGSKIVCGLKVEIIRSGILIQKGLCLDCCGREIFLPAGDKISIPEKDGIYYLVLMYKEIGIDPVPIPGSPGDNIQMEYRRIKETYEIMWQTDNPYENHEFKDWAWKACGKPHPVSIAKIVKRRNSATLVEHNGLTQEQ